MSDGLAPIAISLSRVLLEHGDYVVVGTAAGEFEGVRGEGLRTFMGEVGRAGMDDDEEEDVGEDMELGGDKEDGVRGEGEKKRRKRWRDRFRVVSLDGR